MSRWASPEEVRDSPRPVRGRGRLRGPLPRPAFRRPRRTGLSRRLCHRAHQRPRPPAGRSRQVPQGRRPALQRTAEVPLPGAPARAGGGRATRRRWCSSTTCCPRCWTCWDGETMPGRCTGAPSARCWRGRRTRIETASSSVTTRPRTGACETPPGPMSAGRRTSRTNCTTSARTRGRRRNLIDEHPEEARRLASAFGPYFYRSAAAGGERRPGAV